MYGIKVLNHFRNVPAFNKLLIINLRMFSIELCGKHAYRISIPENYEYDKIIEKFSKFGGIDIKTKHLAVGKFEGSKVSISKNSIVIRDCDREKALKLGKILFGDF